VVDAHASTADASTADASKFEPMSLLVGCYMEICKGDGDCIVSKHIDGYEMSCKYNCKPRNCLNFLVCNSNQENSIMIRGGDLCFSCDIAFGTVLTPLKNVNCLVCSSQNVQGVKRLHCTHSMCLTCFKKAYNGDPPQQVKFPYDKIIELEYLENKWNTKWAEDPLIKEYEAQYILWVEKLHANFKESEIIRKCKECK